MTKATTPEPPVDIDHGQRVAGETHFEDVADQVTRVRFLHKAEGTLPDDENTLATDLGVPPEDSAAVSATELAPSASVWDAREEDEPAAPR
jgi:hypothetical protein